MQKSYDIKFKSRVVLEALAEKFDRSGNHWQIST